MYMLKLENRETVADLEMETYGSGAKQFMYPFMSFGAPIDGFKKL